MLDRLFKLLVVPLVVPDALIIECTRGIIVEMFGRLCLVDSNLIPPVLAVRVCGMGGIFRSAPASLGISRFSDRKIFKRS